MKIEQALHGYYEGHKLLASSVETFSQTDRRKSKSIFQERSQTTEGGD